MGSQWLQSTEETTDCPPGSSSGFGVIFLNWRTDERRVRCDNSPRPRNLDDPALSRVCTGPSSQPGLRDYLDHRLTLRERRGVLSVAHCDGRDRVRLGRGVAADISEGFVSWSGVDHRTFSGYSGDAFAYDLRTHSRFRFDVQGARIHSVDSPLYTFSTRRSVFVAVVTAQDCAEHSACDPTSWRLYQALLRH
jgi:hypothetical protein